MKKSSESLGQRNKYQNILEKITINQIKNNMYYNNIIQSSLKAVDTTNQTGSLENMNYDY